MLNRYTGMIYVGRGTLNGIGDIRSLVQCDKMEVGKICSMDSLDNREIKDLRELMGVSDSLRDTLKQVANEEGYMSDLSNSEDAYDAYDPCREFEISKALQQLGIYFNLYRELW